MTGYLFLGIILFALIAWYVGRRAGPGAPPQRPVRCIPAPSITAPSSPIWVGIPALILVLFWFLFQDAVIDRLIIASLPPDLTDNAHPPASACS
jgi:phosphate transport system permease protein